MTSADDRDREGGGWPKVIGTLSILYAIAGLLCQAGIVANAYLSEWLMGLGGMSVSMPAALKIVSAVGGSVVAVLGIVLLVGGIKLLRRRPSGVTWLVRWAVLRVLVIVLSIAATVVTMPANVEFQQAIAAAVEKQAEQQGGFTGWTEDDPDAIWRNTLVMTAVMGGLAAVYPVFLTFFLARRRIEDEVRQWAP